MSEVGLRAFIQLLETQSELIRVKEEVDWNLELGALSRIGLEHHGPALLFERIKDHEEGYQVFANLIGPTEPNIHGRFALALGLPKDTPVGELIQEFRRRMANRVKPHLVQNAPCKQHIIEGEDIDLFRFPAPLIHGGDGGRYIGTWHVDVTKDPSTGHVNWGMYRHMIIDKQTLGWSAITGQHGPSVYYQSYEPIGEPMPIAIAIGTDPIASVIAATDLPPNVSEPDVAGGILGQSLAMVRCETVDLEVPADAEIVIEGYVEPGERYLEGPIGEYTGYLSGGKTSFPVIHVTCITHRDHPILTVSNMSKPWDDYGVMASVTRSAALANELEGMGLSFKSVYFPPPIYTVIIAARPLYSGYVQTLASAVWATKAGLSRSQIIVVDEDIDITNWDEVMWCLATRCHPERDIHINRGVRGNHLMPFLSAGERENGLSASVLFDATFPYQLKEKDRPTILDLAHGWPQEIVNKTKEHWARLINGCQEV